MPLANPPSQLELPQNAPATPVARRITWTAHADARLKALHNEGVSLRALSRAFGLSRHTLAERASRLGLQLRPAAPRQPTSCSVADSLSVDDQRQPLPSGHPLTWDLITRGTCLHGLAYSVPTGPRRNATDA